ncbi:MAG TPA: YbaB/EbfC family nucleoid-associated protein [Streptosporangiaceae bacterium]|nr:YbaB/EbfC family nucleoid-associated protein [Streptosporangiaceae bacterium]
MEPGGQIDFQQLLQAAAQMQSQLMDAQQQLTETEVNGRAGGGLVEVTINGQGELVDLTIAKDAIDPGDPEETAATLADLIIAACRDAYRALGDIQEQMMGPLAAGFGAGAGGGGFGGFGGADPAGMPAFPGFGGMLGQPPVPGAVLSGDDDEDDLDYEDDEDDEGDDDEPGPSGSEQR